jgi:hypothetical protein
MKPPNVCTVPTTHGRIVSKILNPLGGRLTVVAQASLPTSSEASSLALQFPTQLNLNKAKVEKPTQVLDFTLFHPQTPAQVIDLALINPIYPLTAGSTRRIRTTFHVEKSLGSSAKTHKSQTSLLCDARSHKSHIKSLNVNEIFCTTSSPKRRTDSNSKKCQNKKSLNVTDSEPKPLFYSPTKGSSFYSVQWPSAKTPRSFRLSFALFGFFVVPPFPNPQSAIASALTKRPCIGLYWKLSALKFRLTSTKEETPQIQKTAKIKSHLTLLTPGLTARFPM